MWFKITLVYSETTNDSGFATFLDFVHSVLFYRCFQFKILLRAAIWVPQFSLDRFLNGSDSKPETKFDTMLKGDTGNELSSDSKHHDFYQKNSHVEVNDLNFVWRVDPQKFELTPLEMGWGCVPPGPWWRYRRGSQQYGANNNPTQEPRNQTTAGCFQY